MNPLFSNVAFKLQMLGQQSSWYIVTTKQERFVSQILKANSIELPAAKIFGLDRNMNKIDVLKVLLEAHPSEKSILLKTAFQLC